MFRLKGHWIQHKQERGMNMLGYFHYGWREYHWDSPSVFRIIFTRWNSWWERIDEGSMRS